MFGHTHMNMDITLDGIRYAISFEHKPGHWPRASSNQSESGGWRESESGGWSESESDRAGRRSGSRSRCRVAVRLAR